MAARTTDDMPEKLKPEEHKGFLNELEKARSNAQAAAQECGAILKNYEKNGGHKAVLGLVSKLRKMGDEKAHDYLRSLKHLVDLFNLMPEPDLVDEMEAQAKQPPPPSRKAPPRAASKKATVTDIKVVREANQAARDIAAPATETGYFN
jgi:hypothetical protein